jgi:hypothetical protein
VDEGEKEVTTMALIFLLRLIEWIQRKIRLPEKVKLRFILVIYKIRLRLIMTVDWLRKA